VVSALAPLASEKNLRLENAIPDDLLASADLHAVQCVLRNLLGNALKFTPAGGHVRLDAAPNDDKITVELNVRDTGPGMTANLLAALATSAVVPSGTGTAGERGAGIGLALCRELVAREGGTLTFACPPEGGTVATVRLPAANFPA
jgi:signal transduction histidine kinase